MGIVSEENDSSRHLRRFINDGEDVSSFWGGLKKLPLRIIVSENCQKISIL